MKGSSRHRYLDKPFSGYHKVAEGCMQKVIGQFQAGELDEQAFPSYVNNPNPLAKWLFGGLIWICLDCLRDINNGACLDFGCGSGVLLPFLTQKLKTVYAVDILLEPAQIFLNLLSEQTDWSFDTDRI